MRALCAIFILGKNKNQKTIWSCMSPGGSLTNVVLETNYTVLCVH